MNEGENRQVEIDITDPKNIALSIPSYAEEISVDESLNYIVSKSNELLLAGYTQDFNLYEEKLIDYIISRISPTDEHFRGFRFKAKHLAAVVGMPSNTSNYKQIKTMKNNISGATVRKIHHYDPNDPNKVKDMDVSVFENIVYDTGTGELYGMLGAGMSPWLLHLMFEYGSYRYYEKFNLTFKYSGRLFGQLRARIKRFNTITKMEISLDELKSKLKVEDKASYSRYNNFKSRILNQCVTDLNNNTNMVVSFEEIKKGKSVVAIRFIFSYSKDLSLPEVNDIEKDIKDIDTSNLPVNAYITNEDNTNLYKRLTKYLAYKNDELLISRQQFIELIGSNEEKYQTFINVYDSFRDQLIINSGKTLKELLNFILRLMHLNHGINTTGLETFNGYKSPEQFKIDQ